MRLITLWTSTGRRKAEQIISLPCLLLLLLLRKLRLHKLLFTTFEQAFHQLFIFPNTLGQYPFSKQDMFRHYLLRVLPRADDQSTTANIHHPRR